tara:strand:- start:19 stop:1134 length:1116 start_codon:yes stop_codon:yes gene_type:complete
MKKKGIIKYNLKKIFRSLSYQIFFYIYGKVQLKNKNNQNIFFSEKSIIIKNNKKNFKYSVFNVSNSRLYTDRIQDTAVIKGNTLIDKPSFQLRNNNFDKNINKNIVLRIGTPRIQKKLTGTVVSLLTGGGGNNNYFHWLFDVLPKIGMLEKCYDLNKINFFLCPNLNNWQLRTLNLLGIDKNKCLSSVKYRHIKANNIITMSHPWLKSKNIIYDIENLPLWISKWLRFKFLKKKSNKNFPKKIYIDRSDSESNLRNFRYIVNESEVVNFLKKKGFKALRLTDLSFEEEIKLFNNAEVVVGLQGAGLTNLIWSGNKTKIIELRSKLTNKLFENLALQNKIKFNKIQTNPIEKVIAKHYGTIEIDIKKLEKII